MDITLSMGLAHEWDSAVLPAIQTTRSSLMNSAISESCRDKYVRRWSGPPSEYINNIGWESSLDFKILYSSAVCLIGEDASKTASLIPMYT